MSTGGIFQLIAGDGRADRMLMATALINKLILIERSDGGQGRDPIE